MRRPIGLLALVVPACAAIVLLVLASTGRVPLGHAGTSNGLIVDTMAEERVTPADLAEILLGYPPPGPIGIAGGQIPYSNVTYSGGATGAGAFSGGDGIIGFDAGVVLGSGDVEGVIGPNTALDFSWTTGGAGDADLDAIVSPSTTFDAAVLEFDFVPAGDTIQFRYVFASEEYNFWVHAEFNDVFGFFVNGVNCATVEGDPVSVNTINNGNPFGTDPREHPELYINNDLDDGGGSINTGMNGLTVVLTCFASVTPGETNHIKLAIADAGDFALDSNVFLEGGSFSVVPTATPAAPATPTVPPTVTPTPLPATGTPPPATNTPPPTATATAAPPTNTPPLPTATRTPTLGPPTATRTPTSLPTPTRTPTPSPVPPTNTRPPQPPTPIPPTAPPSATPLPPTATSVSGVLGGGGTIVTPDITNTPTARATPTPRTRPTPTPVSDVLGGTGDPPADPDPPTIARPPIGTGHDGVVPPETTRSILTPGGLSTDPAVIGTNVILAIILLIVLLASSEIFNTTIDENRDKVANFFNRVLAPFRRLAVDLAESPLGGNAALPLLLMVGVPAFVLGLTGLIYTFTEPSLGWNSETLLLFVSVVIAMGIVTYVYEGGQAVFSRLTFGRDAGVRVFPAAIGIAVAFVVFSRVSSFEVPIIYGFVASVALLAPAALDRREEGQTILVPAAVLLSLSLLAWVLIDPLRDLSDGETAWWRYLPGETSALIFAEGVEGLVFVMIPLRFMDGAKVASWNKLLWVPIMGIPLFVFSWVMLNPNAQEFDVLLHGRVRAVIALAGGYAAITLGTWLFFALRARRDAPLDLAPITTTPGGTASTAPIASFPLRSEPPAQVQPPERPDLSRRRDDLSRRRDDS